MNIIIGAGIFALPAIIAANMGSSSIIAYVICGILLALIMLCFAEAGSKVTNTGGAYTFIETAFGDYAGFLGGIFYMGSSLMSDAAVSNALVNVLASSYPIFENEGVRLGFLFVIFFGLAFINVIGIKQGIGLVKFFVIAKLIPLLLLIIFGWIAVSADNLSIEALPSIELVGKTSLILFFAFVGGENGLIVGGEIKNPKRTIPRGIFIGITSVVVIYILIQMVSQGVLGSELPNYTASPLAETAKVAFGPIGFVVLIVGAAISMFGFLSGEILNAPRIPYALARDKVIPLPFLAKIHEKFKTPYLAIITYATIAFIIAATASFEQLVVIATSSILLIYLGVVLSVIKLRYTQKSKPDEFKIPGGLTVPILSIFIIFYFLSSLTSKEMLGTIIFIGALTLIFFAIKLLKKKVL
jgi:amino acid transporter